MSKRPKWRDGIKLNDDCPYAGVFHQYDSQIHDGVGLCHMIFLLDQVDFVEANYRIYECIEMNGMFCSRYIYISIPENHKIWAAERINVLLTNLYSCNQNSPETNINTAAPNFILMWVAEENRKPHGGTYTRVRTRWPHHIHVYIYMYIWKLTKRATEAWMTATRTI